MLNIPSNIITHFNQIQIQIWEEVTTTVTDVCNKPIRFIDPYTTTATPHSILEELAGQKLIIQFSFDSAPEQIQVLIFSQEIFLEISQLFKSETINAVTEDLVSDIQPIVDAIVQGICKSVSNIQNESITSSNIVTHFTNFSLPENLEHEDELIKVIAAINYEELNGSIFWLTNQQNIQSLLVQLNESVDDESNSTQKISQKQNSSMDEGRSIDLLYDIPLEISIELGRVKMLIKDILELSNGSIVEMDKIAGEPVDVMVNGKTVAKGEVIVIDDNFGVRLTEIINPKERLQKI